MKIMMFDDKCVRESKRETFRLLIAEHGFSECSTWSSIDTPTIESNDDFIAALDFCRSLTTEGTYLAFIDYKLHLKIPDDLRLTDSEWSIAGGLKNKNQKFSDGHAWLQAISNDDEAGLLFAVALFANPNAKVSVALATGAGIDRRVDDAVGLRRARVDLFAEACGSISSTDEDEDVGKTAIGILKKYQQWQEVDFGFRETWWPGYMDSEFKTGEDIEHSHRAHPRGMPDKLLRYLQSLGISDDHFLKWFSIEDGDSKDVLWQIFSSVIGYGAKAQFSSDNTDPENDLLLGSVLLPFFAAVESEQVTLDEETLPHFLTTPICYDGRASQTLIFRLYEFFKPQKLRDNDVATIAGEQNKFNIVFDQEELKIRISANFDCTRPSKKHGVSLLDACKQFNRSKGVGAVQGGEVIKACTSLLASPNSLLELSLEAKDVGGEPWTCFILGVKE